jgi:hypothetical protein
MDRMAEAALEAINQYPRIAGVLMGLVWAPILHAIFR